MRDQSQSSTTSQSAPLETQLPVLELLKDFMSGKTVFRNIMGILLPGVNGIIVDRSSQFYGQFLEKAVHLSLEILIPVFEKDLDLADFWRPLYQPLDTILSQDQNQIVALLEYVRYYFHLQIQQCSIKIMSILSSRMVGLVELLLKSNATKCLIEDYLASLDLRSEECQVIENSREDTGLLIIQLLYELCLDPLTRGPTMDLLSNKKYQFFLKHLNTIGIVPLPKRSNNQALRISSLHQDPSEQTSIDNYMVQQLDGTVCKAGANVKKIPLYKAPKGRQC